MNQKPTFKTLDYEAYGRKLKGNISTPCRWELTSWKDPKAQAIKAKLNKKLN